MTEWHNRIVGYDEKPASWFLGNEANWRIHPRPQQDALVGILDTVGWVQDVIVNKRTSPDWGRDQNVETLVDGHLRIVLALRNGEESSVPLKYVDLTPAEESLVLATLDPIAAMAAADREKLGALLQDVQTGEAAVQSLLAGLAEREGITLPEFKEYDETIADGISVCKCPNCGNEHANK